MKKSVYFERYGCNRRLMELNKIKEYFTCNGYEITNNPKKADLVCVSTCAFKKEEQDYSVSKIVELQGKAGGEIYVFGCLPDIAPDKYKNFNNLKKIAPKELNNIDSFFKDFKVKFSEIEDADLPTPGIKELPLIVLKKIFSKNIFSKDFYIWLFHGIKKFSKFFLNKNKISYISIGHGCKGKCSYCAIKYAVGRSISRGKEEIIKELKSKILNGFNNFTMIADDIGAYGLDINSSLPELLLELINRINELEKEKKYFNYNKNPIELNIYELHPKWLIQYKEDLLNILKLKRIKSILCPIQSGNERVIKLMQREHSINELRDLLKQIKIDHPELELTTQIIVGFPSETDSEFNDTLNFLKEVKFDSVVIFPYHDIKNTISYKLNGKISEKTKRDRVKIAIKELKKADIISSLSCPD